MSLLTAGLATGIREAVEAAMKQAGRENMRPEITSGFRTRTRQQALYDNFLACKRRGLQGKAVTLTKGMSCLWPANPPGYSAHEYGLAFDSVVPAFQMDRWTALREAFGFRVPPNDRIHAELPNWRELFDLPRR